MYAIFAIFGLNFKKYKIKHNDVAINIEAPKDGITLNLLPIADKFGVSEKITGIYQTPRNNNQ